MIFAGDADGDSLILTIRAMYGELPETKKKK